MSLANFSGLKAAIAGWLHRSDLTSVIPDFISLTEARLSNDIGDIPLLMSEGTITTATGQRKYAAPAGFIRFNYAERQQPTLTPMQIVPPRKLADAHNNEQYQSVPKFLAFDGVNFIVHPTPNGVYTIPYVYQDTITPLSDTNPVNVILARFPGLYLFGALCEAAPYLSNDQRVALWETKYENALKNARSVDYVGDAVLRTDIAMRNGGFNFISGD